MRTAAATAIAFPYGLGSGWGRRARRAVHLLGAKGTGAAGASVVAGAAKTGVVVTAAFTVAGGAIVLDHHAARPATAHAAVAVRSVQSAPLRTRPVSLAWSVPSAPVDSGPSGGARAGSPLPRVRAAAPKPSPARRARPAPAPQNVAAAPAPSPAPVEPAPAPAAPPRHEPAKPQPTGVTEPPRTPPAPAATEPTPQPQPAPPPTAAGPPPATFTVASYQQSPYFGGTLTLKRISNSELIAAWFGEKTDLRCWYTGGAAPTRLETCTKDRLTAGVQVAEAAHEVNATSGREVWTRVYLIVPR
jgi:hypothetical protein